MNKINVNLVVKIGMLSALAFILQMIGSMMQLKVAGFLEIEFSDFPAIIGALALGPIAGIFIELIKNLIHCLITSTGFVGEFANFVINGTFVAVVGYIYKHNKSRKTAIIALSAGTLAMAVMGALSNIFIMLPLYMPTADFNTKFNLVAYTITPFNLVKGIVLSVITVLTYKFISPLLHKK